MGFRGLDGKIESFIRQEADSLGYTVVDIATRGGKGSFIELTLDKEGGITLDECSAFNGRVRAWMEESGLDDTDLTFDVCSPGLDRELKSDEEYNWALGRQVVVRTYEPVDDSREFRGRLAGVSAASVEVEAEQGKTTCIKRSNISKAKLQVK